MTDWIGQTLSKVKIEQRIGRGGMAEVFVGQHTTLNRRMVVKILYAHLSEDARHIARFRMEAQAVAALRHPNIVQVFDFDIHDGQPYIVMELLEGISLKDHLENLRAQSRNIDSKAAMRLIGKIAQALEYAHGRGVLHRDVKPANVMLCQGDNRPQAGSNFPAKDEPILTDFGLALITSSSETTASGAIVGTPAYMSPEQVQGNSIDARTDIYALGIMAYELLSGRLPFNGEDETPSSIMYKQVHVPPPQMNGASPAVQSVIAKSLAKQPEDRYDKPTEFAKDLRRALAQEAPIKPARRTSNLPGRALIPAVGVALAALVCGVGIVGSWAADPPSELETLPSPTRMAVATSQPAQQPLPTASAPRGAYATGSSSDTLEVIVGATPTLENLGLEDPRQNLQLGEPDYLDEFNHWNHWTQYDIPDKAAYRILDEELTGVDYLPEERYTWWSMLGRQSGNVYTEVTIFNGDCLGKDSAGLAIRVDSETVTGGYGFEISCDGHWQVRRHRVGKSPKELSEWIPAAAIHTGPGAENRLGILAYGNQFWLYVNDQLIGSVEDAEYGRSFGSFALFVRAYLTYDLEARFDDFSFWHIRYMP